MTYKLINENTVLISQPILIQKFGRSSAQILSQIHYWTEKKQGIIKDGIRWIYNTAKDLADQVCLSQRQVERLIQNLKKLGILKVEHFNKYARTNYYAIDYDLLNSLISTETKSDNMSVSDRQNVGIYTKITNKDLNNKSEKIIDGNIKAQTVNQQVEQVIDYDKYEDEKKWEGQGGTSIPEQSLQTEPLLKNKNTTVQDMLAHWNNAFPKSNAKLSKDLGKNLMGAFIHRFEKNMEKWQHYCTKIASSPYLMGRSLFLLYLGLLSSGRLIGS